MSLNIRGTAREGIGNLLQESRAQDILNDDAPLPVLEAAPPVDRWKIFRDTKATNGWALLHDFVIFFDLVGRGEVKHAAGRVSKRLRLKQYELQDVPEGQQRPRKAARVCDLKAAYGGRVPQTT